MSRNACLRFDSAEDLAAFKAERRDRFNNGSRGRIVTPERDILASVLELFKRHPLVAFAYRTNTRSGYVLKHGVYDRLIAAGHIKPGDAQFMRFNFKGAADVTGMLRGGRRFECEVKSDAGIVSDEQQAFIDAVNGGGGVGFVARSVQEAMRGLE